MLDHAVFHQWSCGFEFLGIGFLPETLKPSQQPALELGAIANKGRHRVWFYPRLDLLQVGGPFSRPVKQVQQSTGCRREGGASGQSLQGH